MEMDGWMKSMDSIEKENFELDSFLSSLQGTAMPSTPEQDAPSSPSRFDSRDDSTPDLPPEILEELSRACTLDTPQTVYDDCFGSGGSILPELVPIVPIAPIAPKRPSPKIDSVVTSIKIRRPPDADGIERVFIDLNLVMQKVKNAKYNTRRFHGIILSPVTQGPTRTMFIFSNGRVTGFGASVADSLLHARQAVQIVRKVLPDEFGPDKGIKLDTKICNIHATSRVDYPVNIYGLSLDPRYSKTAFYEPDVFCGLTFRMFEPRTTSLIYLSGKIQILAKSEEDIKKTMELLETVVLPEFRGNAIEPKKTTCFSEKKKGKKRKTKIAKKAEKTQKTK